MSFVPLQGPATWVPRTPPRESEVEFTDAHRTMRMPMRGAIPVLTRALRVDDAHPSVTLLGGAALMAMRLVAAGRIRLDDSGESWRVGALLPDERERIDALAQARAHGDTDTDSARELVVQLIDAVADTMTRPPEVAHPSRRSLALAPQGSGGLGGSDDGVHQVRITLRIEAPEEALVGGGVVVVPQAHDVDDDTHFVDAGLLWGPAPDAHGFSPRARLSLSGALRRAARAWPVLERLQRQPVPDRLVLEAEELVDLLDGGLGALAEAGVDVFWPRGLREDLVPTGRVEVAPRSGEGQLVEGLFGTDALFSFDWRLALGSRPEEEPLTDNEMAALARARSPVIKLRDNWVIVDPALARKARNRVTGPGRSRQLTPGDALQAALTGTLYLDGGAMEVHAGATLEKVRDRIVDAAVVAPLDPPAGLAAKLRDYQRRGMTWLAELTGVGLGACLADDMGLGKTITLIALHLHRRERRLASGPTLVVCPASLIGNWEAEVRRFAPGVAVRRFHGTSRSLEGLARRDAGFVLTTYGTMRADGCDDAAQLLRSVPWDLVVADEAQHIKNARSSTARHLRSIASRCRVALTGTPVENDLTELWAILDWATPGLLGSRNAFRRVWAAPIENGVDPEVARRFAQLVGPFLLRRRKTDPGIAPELPPKTETDHPVRLTREQAVLYEAVVRTSMEKIERADEATRRGLVLAMLTALKQICNHPAHYLRQPSGRLAGRSEKWELTDELLRTIVAEGGSALVFTQYVEMARLLERHLATTGVPTLFLHGGTPVRAREQMVAQFQSQQVRPRREGSMPEGTVPVFLLSLKAGGTGLNLTQADHVIHYDRWWNPAVEDQATDRAHRIGQTRPVQVHRMVTEGTIEERIDALLTRKRALSETVLGSGDAALTELTDTELHDLVALRPTDRAPGDDADA